MRHSLQWICAALICCLLVLACARANIGGIRPGPITSGTDLLASYAAGQLVRDHHAEAMYDRAGMTATEQRIMDQSGIVGDARFLPWMNPPFAALPFVPLACLPFRMAAVVWLAINIGLIFGCLLLLRDLMPGDLPLPRVILLWLAVCLSMPFWQAMYAQQNTFISLTLLCLVARFWMRGKSFPAGVIAGLMLFKPQLAMVIAVVLGISMGAEAIAGFVLVAVALLDVTAIALPGTLSAYVHQLPATVHWLQMELPYNWGRQTTLQGFWRLMIQGHAAGPTALSAKALAAAGAMAIGVPLTIAAWRSRGGDAGVRRRLIAAAIVATPMLAPYCMDYDLLLLAVAAALTIAEKPPRSAGLTEKAIVGGWIVLATALYLNPFVAADGRCNVAVIAIAAMALLLFRNALAHLPRVTAADRPFLSARASALSR